MILNVFIAMGKKKMIHILRCTIVSIRQTANGCNMIITVDYAFPTALRRQCVRNRPVWFYRADSVVSRPVHVCIATAQPVVVVHGPQSLSRSGNDFVISVRCRPRTTKSETPAEPVLNAFRAQTPLIGRRRIPTISASRPA